MRFAHISLPLLCAAVCLTGCGYTASTISHVQPAAKGIHGTIMGGQQPVVGAAVQVWALGTGGTAATGLGTATSDAGGNFVISAYDCPAGPFPVPSVAKGSQSAARASKSVVKASLSRGSATAHGLPDLSEAYLYITATGGNPGGGTNSSILLAAALGPCDGNEANDSVEINEVSTVVFATAMANYDGNLNGANVGTSASDLESIAAMDVADANTVEAFVNTATGMVNPNVTAAPGGVSVTIEAAKIYSLANTIASCVNSADDVTTTPGTSLPSANCTALFADLSDSDVTDTLDAALVIAGEPFYNVPALWMLGVAKAPFLGGLGTAPNDWTLGISYSTSAMGLGLFPDQNGVPMSSNIDIDSYGRVWFPSNKSGATGVGYFDPTQPASTGFSGPFGTGMVQPQYVALDDTQQKVFVTDLATANIVFVDTTPGGLNTAGSFPIPDEVMGGEATWTGPLFINSDDSLDVGYRDSAGGQDLIEFSSTTPTGGLAGTFLQPPAAVTLNTTLGTDPNDPSNPIGVGATSGSNTACSLEVVGGQGTSSQGTLPTAFGTTTSPCASGGAATGAVFGGKTQDEVTTATTASEICSQLIGDCFQPTVKNSSNVTVNLANNPVGVAFDGGNQLWMANSGNASIAVILGQAANHYVYGTDRPYVHGTDEGGTMTNPAGIAVDSAGNVWVSNANCTSLVDTTCSFTLSEVIGIGFPTITPLANQANQLQGTEPSTGADPLAGGKPVAAASSRPAPKGKAGGFNQ